MGSIRVGELADTVMRELNAYSKLKTDDLKKAVTDAAKTVKEEIAANAPKDTGAYAKSWAVKKVNETSTRLTLTVHSKNRYQLAHLLEFGHATRCGGRTKAQPHIAFAEEKGVKQLEEDISRSLNE